MVNKYSIIDILIGVLLLGATIRWIGLAIIIQPRGEARESRRTMEANFSKIGPCFNQENAKTFAEKYELALSTFYRILDYAFLTNRNNQWTKYSDCQNKLCDRFDCSY